MPKSFEENFIKVARFLFHVGLIKLLIALFVFVAVFSLVAIEITGTPKFCNSCHIMNEYHASWKKSSHSKVKCLKCHIKPGVGHYMRGKINGLAQAVDCIVGRVGTKPNGHVADESCLRSGCHKTEKLTAKPIDFNGIKFTHKKHIDKVVNGITLHCGTCHSHFEGDEHFSVSPKTCFSCHFIKSEHSTEELVKTKCLDCHNVPDKEIQRGFVKINHQEFASYQASCADSCHKGQVEIKSNVTDFTCLNCHDYGIEGMAEKSGHKLTSEKLHQLHDHGEKVECFACHGGVRHGPTKGHTVASMASCENCHSDTHNIQKSIFGAEHHPGGTEDNKILSPMFLTHVECSDCHIKKVKKASSSVESFGTVAKAVPAACDRCHEKGTGDRYVPFWQKQIKSVYARAEMRLKEKTQLLDANPDISTDENRQKIQQAAKILESVKADGSWGVHNLKYTEAILLKAKNLLSQVE